MEIIIILAALWLYPILSYFIIRLTKNNAALLKKIVSTLCVFSIVSLVGFFTNISTTASIIDWMLITTIYLLFLILLWLTQFQKRKFIKIIGLLILLVTIGLNYLLGTVGALGLAMVVGQLDVDKEQWFGDGIIVKQSTIGNALTDYRGKKVEIYQTWKWLPIFEYRIQQKEYMNIITYGNPLAVSLSDTRNTVFLSTSMIYGPEKKNTYNWADTLIIKTNK